MSEILELNRGFPINAEGSVVLGAGQGGTTVTSYLPAGMLPLNEDGSISVVGQSQPTNKIIKGTPLIRAPKDLTGLTTAGGGTSLVTTRNGRRCVEITLPVGVANTSLYLTLPTGFTASGNTEVMVELDDASQFNGGSVQLNYMTDTNFNVGMRYIYNISTAAGWSGVHQILGADADWVAVGAGTWGSAFTQFQLKLITKAGGVTGAPTKIYVYEVVQNEKDNLPMILLGADDGHITWYNEGVPILEKHGLRSYLAYIHDVVGTTNYMTPDNWKDIVARGHEVVVHGTRIGKNSLRDYFTNYAPFDSPYAAIVDELKWNRDNMVALGLDPSGLGRKCYVYPQGFHQPSGVTGDKTIPNALADTGFKWGRLAALNGSMTTGSNMSDNLMYTPIIGHWWSSTDETTNINNLITKIQTEIAAKRSVILMFHIVRTTPAAQEDISPANLTKVCAAIAKLVNDGACINATPTEMLQAVNSRTIYQ